MHIKSDRYCSYNSMIDEGGNRIRRLYRTELSLQKIKIRTPQNRSHSKRVSRHKNSGSRLFNRSTPKLQKLFQIKASTKTLHNESQVNNQYYGRPAKQKSTYSKMSKPSTINFPKPKSQIKHKNIQNICNNEYIDVSEQKQIFSKSSFRQFQSQSSNLQRSQYEQQNNSRISNKPQQISKIKQIQSEKQNSYITCRKRINNCQNSKISQLKQQVQENRSGLNFGNNQNEQPKINQGPIMKSKLGQRFSKMMKSTYTGQKKWVDTKLMAFSEQNKQKSAFKVSQGQNNMKDSGNNTKGVYRLSNDMWKDTIRTFNEVSALNMNSVARSSSRWKMGVSNRMSLKLESIRRHNHEQSVYSNQPNERLRKSFKNLPISSRQPSQNWSNNQIGQTPFINTLQNVIDRIQIHEYLINLLLTFSQQTIEHYSQKGQSDKYQILSFLLQRKYLYQKRNMIKALKGGKNIFNLSSLQIPDQSIRQHMGEPKIIQLIKQYQQNNKNFFKRLQKTYHDLRISPTHRKNKLLTLQTPLDNFTKYIIVDLDEQINELYESLQKSRISEQGYVELQDRIIESVQIIFLLSELAGRKTKKIEFADEIMNFEEYYEQILPQLVATIQYFYALNY